MDLDLKNCVILKILQENSRSTLTEISKAVGLSIDSVKNRIDNMIENEVFFPRIQLRPRHFGFPNIVDIRMKLHNYSEREFSEFVAYLKEHPRVSEIFSLSGEWNFAIVVISKDWDDLGRLTQEIRGRFGKIIAQWSESLTTKVYKFEKYDMEKLLLPPGETAGSNASRAAVQGARHGQK